MIALVFFFVLFPLGFWWLIQRRWNGFPVRTPLLLTWYLVFFSIPLIVPYRLLEKTLYNILDGLGGAWLISAFTTVIELTLLTCLIVLVFRNLTLKRSVDYFPFWLLLGIGFGLGKIFRDILLVFFHFLARFYGYSQFSTFLTGPFLIQRALEMIFGIIACALLAIGWHRGPSHRIRRFSGFFLLSFVILQLESLPRLSFQFIPLFSLFIQAYLIGLLPILVIISSGVLWYLYRRGRVEGRDGRDEEMKGGWG